MRAKVQSFTHCSKVQAVRLVAVFLGGTSVSLAAIEPSNSPSSSSPVAIIVLPDAPRPDLAGNSAAINLRPPDSMATAPDVAAAEIIAAPSPRFSRPELDAACQAGTVRGKPCRVKWLPVVWEAFEATAFENAGNIAFDQETRHDLAGNPFWSTYFKCVRQLRYDQWRDDDNFVVDYVGHGLQGGIVASSFEQHDPKGRGVIYVNNGNYWRSRLKAMAWVAVYEVQWKIGPASEASIGNSGLNTYFTPRVHGRSTNETGFQDFVDTPVVGFGWNVGEDALDRFLMPHIWAHTHNRLVLGLASVLTPGKGGANLLRFKPPYYRDFPITPVR
ncbi:MAG TPA: hypothetical protein VF865_15130 [Acidobacteriaceae bacterium]